MKIAIVGAGWAGMAAAVRLCEAGHSVTVFEASRQLGGRARALPAHLPDGRSLLLDNGQHILIGAYAHTLALLQTVGVVPADALLRLPLTLVFPDGHGLALPQWPSPLDALAGIWGARGWDWQDKWALLRCALAWQRKGFGCADTVTVAQLCRGLTPRVMHSLIEPLCVSALNTPAEQACGAVFLRVLQDSLFGGRGASNLLLPRVDLGTLFPEAAAAWLARRGAQVHLGCRVEAPQYQPAAAHRWQVQAQNFDAVVWATSASHAAPALAPVVAQLPSPLQAPAQRWLQETAALRYEAITTVYAFAPGAYLAHPMLALHSGPEAPAQFVFDRGQLGGVAGLLAFVVSASQGERHALEQQVLAQARTQLGLHLQPVQTVVERRATFACTPALARPAGQIAPGLLVCGDYVQGPYPATLEGAVRSALNLHSLLPLP